MVAAFHSQSDDPDSYEEQHEQWPDRATRKRAYRRKDNRRIVVRSERLSPPDAGRVSKALLAAQRDLARAAAEAQAQAQAHAHAEQDAQEPTDG